MQSWMCTGVCQEWDSAGVCVGIQQLQTHSMLAAHGRGYRVALSQRTFRHPALSAALHTNDF